VEFFRLLIRGGKTRCRANRVEFFRLLIRGGKTRCRAGRSFLFLVGQGEAREKGRFPMSAPRFYFPFGGETGGAFGGNLGGAFAGSSGGILSGRISPNNPVRSR